MLLMSLTFAVAAVRLSRRGMLVQYMNAVESIANVDTVCSTRPVRSPTAGWRCTRWWAWTAAATTEARELVAAYAAAAGSRNATVEAIPAGLAGQAFTADQQRCGSRRAGWSAFAGRRLAGAGRATLAGRAHARGGGGPRAGRRAGAGLRPWPLAAIDPDSDQRPPPPLEPVALVGAGGAAARRRGRHDRLPAPAGSRGEGDVGDSAATVSAVAEHVGAELRRARLGRRRPARGGGRSYAGGARGCRLRAADARPQARAGGRAHRLRRLRCHDWRRRRRHASNEAARMAVALRQRQSAAKTFADTCW